MKTIIKELKALNKTIKTDKDLIKVSYILNNKYTTKQLRVIWNKLYDTNFMAELNLISSALLINND